ncbi:apolipoprotein N-acyltransferase [Dactylosporangium matsuzakiense]|uniref:apolipoprotein N-acyltransferase n=1 Tax=Dactylosporangium matsuzakiense TaxID=53360 RepID=UPI002206DA60|nr:apolipoprotein N-acyltransferase [Dactylosporangium matsuzakiense]
MAQVTLVVQQPAAAAACGPVDEPVLPLWAAILAAAVAGGAMLVAFPPYGQWWAAPAAVALLAVAVHGRRLRAGFWLGCLTGVLFFTPLLAWTNLHTGMVPWLLLSVLETLYFGLVGLAGAWIGPLLGGRQRWNRGGWSWPVAVGLLWVAQEALRDRTPFGGFPWGRLAFSQDTSPLLRLAAAGGAPLVTFAVALAGGLAGFAVLRGIGAGTEVRRAVAPLAAVAAGCALIGVAALVPLTEPAGPAVYVAVVQGNVPRLGLDFNAQRRAVLDNHVKATIALGDRVKAGARRPDLVVWPENASDIDPLRNTDAGVLIGQAADAVGAPILVGAVLYSPETGVENAGLVFNPGRQLGDPVSKYVKRHPVPFAETMPLRSVARLVSSEVDRVTDMTAGTSPGVLRVGPATVGDVICFEVAYDGLVRDTVTGGGQLIAVQTNNATFNEAEARQQLAMVRLRAVEHGRDALMASTVGISAFADATGATSAETAFDKPAVIVAELHLGDRRTLATRLGAIPEYTLVAFAVLGLVAALAVRRRDGGRDPDPHPVPEAADGPEEDL